MTEKDTILLTDFVNTTGDAVFDGTLKQALTVQLGQSPFLSIFSEDRVRGALRFMGRSPDERVTRDVAREICQRQGLKAMLSGSIASLGSHYVITLEATNAQTGDAIADEQVEAESKEQVLSALGVAATKLRQKLGESLASIQKFDAPIEQATTSSLEAFKAFSLGFERQLNGNLLRSHSALQARGGNRPEFRPRLCSDGDRLSEQRRMTSLPPKLRKKPTTCVTGSASVSGCISAWVTTIM